MDEIAAALDKSADPLFDVLCKMRDAGWERSAFLLESHLCVVVKAAAELRQVTVVEGRQAA